MAQELYSNDASTTVALAADAPASGTGETWVVASSASFPAAATGVTQFHVADPGAPSEIILVTNVAGTSWSVTRGAESTTPVTHTAGYTVAQVLTAGDLTALATYTGDLSLVSGVTEVTGTHLGSALPVLQGGTGGTTATAALTSLGAAPLASPALTGSPTAPTQTAGDNSTKIATDAFVVTAVATNDPNMVPGDAGYVMWTAPLNAATFGNVSATYLATNYQAAGNLAWIKVRNPNPGQTITGSIRFAVTKGSSGFAGSYGALYDNTGAQIWVSADVSGDASFVIENKSMGITTLPAPFYYFVALVATQGSTGGGIIYTLGGPGLVSGLSATASGSGRWQGCISGQAYGTMPSVFSPTATGATNAVATPWFGIY